MPAPPARRTRLAAPVLTLLLASGCVLVPSRWVEARTAPPAAVAPAPAPEGTTTP